MPLKVKAKEKLQKIGKYADSYRYVMMPELYSTLTQDKVIKEAALRSGVSQGVMQACWDAAGEVIKAWATEGHSVALPGLGTMRFGLRAKSCANVNEVKTSLIKTRRIIFTPDVELKDELHNTSIQITCYDRNGEVVKRVTSSDPGTVEDPEEDNGNENENEGGNGNQNQNENQNGGNTGGNSGTGTINPEPGTMNPKLTISRSGSGTSQVSANGNAVNSGSELSAGTEVSISVTPAEGAVPTASLNGSSVTLTESDGVYTGNFQMPSSNATLTINSGGSSGVNDMN